MFPPSLPSKKYPLAQKCSPVKFLLSLSELPSNLYRTLPLAIPNYIRNRILRRYADAYMHVVAYQMPFDYLRLLVQGQLVKYLAHVPTQHSKYAFLPYLL